MMGNIINQIILVSVLLFDYSVVSKDYLYKDYKDKTCATKNWRKVRCVQTKTLFWREDMLVYWRYNIEWAPDRIPLFAHSFVCACAAAAKEAGVRYFATHFWGECFGLLTHKIVSENGDCRLANGNYSNPTYCHENYDAIKDQECLAIENYYLYETIEEGCPPDMPMVNCIVNPCDTATCIAHPSATCKANYCGGCNADFYVDDMKVECGCPPDMPTVNCIVNPCDTATCASYPSAECTANYCGGCNADFYVNDKKVVCGCPRDMPMVNCIVNPCDTATCTAYPSAECTANYCGGCNADFYVNDTKVACGESNGNPPPMIPETTPAPAESKAVSTPPPRCPRNKPMVTCVANPCDTATCKAHPSAICKANYCGGCKADFYVNDKKVKCRRGKWGDWGDWTPCSTTCGKGEKHRERVCSAASKNPCVGKRIKSRKCNLRACPKARKGKWGDWGDWTPCSTTCGKGEQHRERLCSAASKNPCVGKRIKSRKCNLMDCPVVPSPTKSKKKNGKSEKKNERKSKAINGKWSKWSWTECSVTCGGGKRMQTRSCNNPAPGPGGKKCRGKSEGKSGKCNSRKCRS